MDAEQESRALLDRVFREEAARLTASLVRLLGDFHLAEDLVADAVAEALDHWPRDGAPERPAAWLFTTARRKGLDRLRRDAVYRDKLRLLASLGDRAPEEPDDRLRLIFTCCHPALSRDAQVALTLCAVAGLSTEEIARAFLVSEETLAKRIVRAKRKIVASGIPYRVPAAEERAARLDEVLTVIYLIFNEGYVSTAGEQPIRRDLARDAEWLAQLVCRLLPHESEPLGLLALIRLHLARWPARLDGQGRLVLLRHQDRAQWDRLRISAAEGLIEQAAHRGPPGRYLLEAMIAAVHCDAPTWEQTDWAQILALYSLLTSIDPSPVVALNRAIARRHVDGARAALHDLEPLAEPLRSYHLYHATRATLLRDVGRDEEAANEDELARTLTKNRAERELLRERRIGHVPGGDSES